MTRLFDYFRARKNRSSASVAKERLQIIVAHERKFRNGAPDYLPNLQRELLEVVRKYVHIEDNQVKIHMERDGDCEVLELNIVLLEAKNSGGDGPS